MTIRALFASLTCGACLLSAIDSAHLRAAEKAQQYNLTKRASEIDPAAKEYPAIGFTFKDDKGKTLDLQHAVVDTRVKSRGKLVIWLMGHNQGLFDRVAGYGLHGIQVHYANGWFGKITNEQRDSGDTLGKIRLEAATGEDHSPLVEIAKPDSIAGRSLRFVKWLAKENPAGQWDQFVTSDGNDLVWDKVVLSGISHGSTTAARFAIHQKVDRVVMFSGPRDQTETWQALPSATPHNRFFGFTHVLDGGWTADHYCRSWQLLKLNDYGPLVDVDATPAPYGNSRRLITNADVGGKADRAHGASVPGGAAVKNAEGKFIHEDVWRYLFTHPVDEVGQPVPVDPDCQVNQKK